MNNIPMNPTSQSQLINTSNVISKITSTKIKHIIDSEKTFTLLIDEKSTGNTQPNVLQSNCKILTNSLNNKRKLNYQAQSSDLFLASKMRKLNLRTNESTNNCEPDIIKEHSYTISNLSLKKI